MNDNPLKDLPKPIQAFFVLVCGVVLLFTGPGAIVGVILILIAIMMFRDL